MFDQKNVFLGIAPIGWCNDDMPELGAENTFQQIVSEMALAGFTGCEIGNKFPSDPQALKKALPTAGPVQGGGVTPAAGSAPSCSHSRMRRSRLSFTRSSISSQRSARTGSTCPSRAIRFRGRWTSRFCGTESMS